MNDSSPNADELRARMQMLRDEIRLNGARVKHSIEYTKTEIGHAFDWKRQVVARPWLWGGLALACGYALMPSKATKVQKELGRLQTAIDQFRESAAKVPAQAVEAIQPSQGLFKKVLGNGGKLLGRAALSQVQQQGLAILTGWLTAKTAVETQAANARSNAPMPGDYTPASTLYRG